MLFSLFSFVCFAVSLLARKERFVKTVVSLQGVIYYVLLMVLERLVSMIENKNLIIYKRTLQFLIAVRFFVIK